ncbi:hypothetical protein MTR67_047485, partial [Solanum verrucosum]
SEGERLSYPGRYKRLVGKLNYLTVTLPNIAFLKSKKQNMVARSSATKKYQGMVMAACELIWIKQLLKELKFGEIKEMEQLICWIIGGFSLSNMNILCFTMESSTHHGYGPICYSCFPYRPPCRFPVWMLE